MLQIILNALSIMFLVGVTVSCDPIASTSYTYRPTEISVSGIRELTTPAARKLGLIEESRESKLLHYRDEFPLSARRPALFLTVDTSDATIVITEAITFKHTERKQILVDELRKELLREDIKLLPIKPNKPDMATPRKPHD